ncbi:leucine-rich repeat neuronal protein 4 [Centroberyx gerrardi]|uniref:leucine-rich repeat neuronal protein 4 n=1 Tax=Centroberyx gerrardi TaxID=166262 RepID=UPI003AAC9CDF
MMAASRDLALPLVLISLLLIRGYASLATTGTSLTRPLRPRGSENAAADLPPEDYYDTSDDTVTTTTTRAPRKVSLTGSKPQQCDYDACLEMQPPCADLADSTGCLCRGITLDHVAPEAPALKKVSREGSGVVVRWCAPYSYVTAYKVTVGGEEREVGEGQRSFAAGRIDDTVKVCVVAVNDAGASEGSCTMYEPEGSSVSLKAGLIGGALGFLLLFSLAVLLWRHRVRRKSGARISTRDMEETPRTELESRGGQDAL